ncbi:hypothetical protein D3C76_567210 [compost metagenome]
MCGLLDLECARNADQLARLQGFQLGQLFTIGFKQVGELEEYTSTCCWAGTRPIGETLTRRVHCTVDIGLVGVGDLSDGLAIGWVDYR